LRAAVSAAKQSVSTWQPYEVCKNVHGVDKMQIILIMKHVVHMITIGLRGTRNVSEETLTYR
jgi:hypothetical protein